ncbi:MAG TPA: DUF2279 domain-containing protein [Candidatus Latescibacteria bacterium]|nr:DUF2279 domain-containing protein [Candidatus Latescibacterota bacterium]
MRRFAVLCAVAVVFTHGLAHSEEAPQVETHSSAREGAPALPLPAAREGNFSLDDLPPYRHQGISRGRLAIALAGVGVYDVAFYETLKKPWWSGTKSDMHVINDWWNGYAMEVDKAAHAFAGQSMARLAAESYEWTGMTRTQALFWGGVTSLATLSQVEVLDGYTAKFGFSTADYAANIAGAFFPLAQEMWHPLKTVTFKISYHTRRFEEHGNNGNILEDYDRQTYWLVLNLKETLPRPVSGAVPAWLGIAAGYGVENAFASSGRMREYYLGLDIDPTRANVGPGWLSRALAPLRYVHLPSPAVRFREDGTRFFALYF